jgi:hypothetical protein
MGVKEGARACVERVVCGSCVENDWLCCDAYDDAQVFIADTDLLTLFAYAKPCSFLPIAMQIATPSSSQPVSPRYLKYRPSGALLGKLSPSKHATTFPRDNRGKERVGSTMGHFETRASERGRARVERVPVTCRLAMHGQ